jgi:hypothetical protein
MNFEFDEKWLENAVQIEDESNCDIQAGLEFGQDAHTYISEAKSYIDYEKLMVILKEGLGAIFQNDELESLASDLQSCTRERVLQKLQIQKSA